jgi:hypothetical protein
MDRDLEEMNREELIAEIKKLSEGIRQHRDSTDDQRFQVEVSTEKTEKSGNTHFRDRQRHTVTRC